MSRPFAVATALLSFALLLGYGAPAQAERKDHVVQLSVPSAAQLGSYSGSARFALGEVTDATFAESDSHVGMGPQAIYEIVSEGSRAEATRKGVALALQQAGLLAATPGEATHTVDVTIRRYREQTHMTIGRFRLRAEIFLEFDFRKDGVSQGRLLASGNAQQYAQIAAKAKYAEVYQAAFNDAIHKAFNSKTLARIAGEGWTPVPGPAEWVRHKAVRIMKDEFYGPTDTIQAQAAQAAQTLSADGVVDALWLPDFQLDAVTGKSNTPVSDLAFARALVPALVREHLDAFFPGAFPAVQRQAPATPASGLTVEGQLDNFRVGNWYAKSIIGFGAGKDKIEGDVVFKDAATGATLFQYRALSSNWGAGWQAKQGSIRDMADQLARDIAYFLVKTRVPDYQPPVDLEVLFDDSSYPAKQRKS